MQRTTWIRLLLLVLVVPIIWLGYWVTWFDDISANSGVLGGVKSTKAGQVTFTYYYVDEDYFQKTFSYTRSLDLATGHIKVSRYEGVAPELADLSNKAGTRLTLRIIPPSKRPAPRRGICIFTHSADSLHPSNGAPSLHVPVHYDGSHTEPISFLTEENKLVIKLDRQIQVWDVSNGFKLIGELQHDEYFHQKGLNPTDNSRVFVATKVLSLPSGSRFETGLYRINQSGITELSSWKHNIHVYPYCSCDKGLCCISPDLSEIHLRSLDDGSIVSRNPIDKSLINPFFVFQSGTTLARVVKRSGEEYVFNARTNELVPVLMKCPDRMLHFASTGQYLLLYRNRSNGTSKVLSIAGSNGEAIDEYSADFIVEELQQDELMQNRLMLLGQPDQMRVSILEVTPDGKFRFVQTHAPLKWLALYQVVLCCLLALWLCAFQFLFQKDSLTLVPYSVATATLLGAIFVLLFYRISVSGDPADGYRWEYRFLIGLGFAMITFGAIWCVFGSQRLGLRVVVPILIVGTLLALVYFSAGNRDQALPSMTFGLTACTCGMLVMFGLLRWMGLRFERRSIIPVAITSNVRKAEKGPIRITDIFLVTTAVAFLFAVVRLAEGSIIPQIDRIILSSLLAIITIGVGTPIFSLARISVWFKWPAVIAFGASVIFASLLFAYSGNSKPFSFLVSRFQELARDQLVFSTAVAYVMIGLYRHGLRLGFRRGAV